MSNISITLAERLSQNSKKMTSADMIITEYLLNNYPMSLLQNASELASTLNLNIATVTRFFTKLGYTNAKEAMAEFRNEIAFYINSPSDRLNYQPCIKQDGSPMLDKILEEELKNINATFDLLDPQKLKDVAKILGIKGKKIFIIGAMKESSIAQYLYMQLLGLSNEVYIYGKSNLTNFLLHIDKDSICIFFDFRRHANVSKKICEYAKKNEANIVVVSDSRVSPTAFLADYLFTIPSHSTSIFDSYTGAIAFINALMAFVVYEHRDSMRPNYQKLEEIYKDFDIFTFSK